MKRTTTTIFSIGLSVALIALGILFLCKFTGSIWPGNGRWFAGHHGMMGGGIVMMIFWFVAIVAIVLLTSGAVSGFKVYQTKNLKEDALSILKERYAKGEIDKAEYEVKRDDLKM